MTLLQRRRYAYSSLAAGISPKRHIIWALASLVPATSGPLDRTSNIRFHLHPNWRNDIARWRWAVAWSGRVGGHRPAPEH